MGKIKFNKINMKFFAIATIATVSANQFEYMNEDELLVNLESTLSSALSSEARGDADAAVAKTAAIKNIQKALTARILNRLDDGQPLVEVARKIRPSRACSHRSTIWREDSVSCSLSSQSSRTPSRPSKRSSMSEEWARNEQLRLRVDFDFLLILSKLIYYKYLRANNLLV